MSPSAPRPRPRPATTSGGIPSLSDRVKQRVAEASKALDRTHRARRPALKRGTRPPVPASPDLEMASLRAVFRELGDAHRQYRMRTGQPGTPALRVAAHAFKRTPTLASLVTVAAFFDELGLLAW